ncbi:hypothetical protein ACIQ6R_22545 [Streptomyces sp. NPDC096048]|uniref:hypothetical protein n=1 Tax=Streptomyces sp. NPDC096048 TaxID=3366072 RepID=UPI0037F9FC7C
MKVSVLRTGLVAIAAVTVALGAPAAGAVAQVAGDSAVRVAVTQEDPSWDGAQKDPSWDSVQEDPSWDSAQKDPSWDSVQEDPSWDSAPSAPSEDPSWD